MSKPARHNFSSDSNGDSKRDSKWWRNLSDISRRYSNKNPNSIVLNTNSTITGSEDSHWWRNLSNNDNVSLPNKSNIVEKNEDRPDRVLSHSESDNDVEDIFPQKRLFSRQEQRSQKSRFSKAFNLNTEKITEDQVHQSGEQNLETEEFKNQLVDDMKMTESPTSKVTKGTKKRRKTKSIFSKNLGKRKFSDAFKVTDYEPEESEQINKDALVQKQEFNTENISISEEPINKKSKESLFNLDRQKKKYSEAFLNVFNCEPVEKTPNTEKSGKQVQTSQIVERVSKVKQNSESSDEEINIEEIQTQKDASYDSNRSLNVSKRNKTKFLKTIEKTPQNKIYSTIESANTRKANLSNSTSKNKKPIKKVLYNDKEDSESEDEIIIEEIKTQKETAETSIQNINLTKEMKTKLFKRGTKKQRYSEAFLGPSSSRTDDNEDKKIENDYEVDETKPHSSYVKNSQILREEKNESSEEENIKDIRNQNKSVEKSINITKDIKKNLFNRLTKSRKYSEAFLGPSSSRIDDNEDKKIENDYEVDEIKPHSSYYVKNSQILREEKNESSDEENIKDIRNQNKSVEKSINITKDIKTNLFNRHTKSRKYSEAFLSNADSKILEIDEQEHVERLVNKSSSNQHAKDSLYTQQNQNRQAFINIIEGDDENKENNSASSVFVEENAAKQRIENLKKLKHTKDSQAFLELISMQKPVEEKRNIKTNTEHIEDRNKVSIKETAKKEDPINELDNDTKFSSIASIDISAEIKHPLFRPKPRKSLYSVKSETKNNEHSNIQSDHNSQQNLRKSKIQKVSAKRYSLRSTSPADSISHFFDTSLISSTKLFINPNENKDTGSEGSVKKGRRSVKSVAVVHENSENIHELDIEEAKDKKRESEVTKNNKTFTPKKGRKSKSVINVPEDLRNDLTENKATNEEFESVATVKNKISTSKRNRKSESLTGIREELENNVPENEITNDDLIKYKNPILKTGRISKSLIKVSEVKKNYVPENEAISERDSDLEAIVKNKISTSKSGRKSESVIGVREDQVIEIPENDITNNESIKYKNSIPKRGRISKSVIKEAKNKNKYVSENEEIDMENNESKEIIKNKISTSKRGRKSALVIRVREDQKTDSPEIEITKHDESAKTTNYTPKRGRKSKSATKILEDQKNYVSENESIDEKDSETEEMFKNIISTSKREQGSESVTGVREDLENYIPKNEITKDDESAKFINSISKRGRKSKSVPRATEDSESELVKRSDSNEVDKKKKRDNSSKSIPTVSENVNNIENMDKESERSVKKKNSIVNKSITTDENYASKDASENYIFVTENKNDEMDIQMKQNEIDSKIPTEVKTVTNVFQKQDISKFVDKNIVRTEIDVDSGETVKRKILPIINKRKSKSIRKVDNRESGTSEDEIIDLDDIENSCRLSTAMPIYENQRQSSKFSADKHLESKSESNIITIHSSTSRARSSQFSNTNEKKINIENWLYSAVEQDMKNRPSQAFPTNIDFIPGTKRIKTIDRWKTTTPSETSETKKIRNELLLKAVKNVPEKKNESKSQESHKKITDFFSKVKDNEKFKPIPKNTNIVKKVPKPVCTARLINGKPYYSRKLFHGKRWCNPRFYKVLQDKMRNEYGDETINESESLMKLIANSVQIVIKAKKYLKVEVDNLKKNLAKRKIVVHDHDFFSFCLDYLPAEYRDLVVPGIRVFPYDPEDYFKPIEF